MKIETLNNNFAIEGHVSFKTGNGGLPFLMINNQYCTASISLYGAQILSYIPCNQQDVLWVSSKSLFEEGKAIRGGIPLCFPWFGPHTTDKTKPQHGFARISEWEVDNIEQLQQGATHIQLSLQQSAATLALWPYSFKAIINFIVGNTLQVTFSVTNTDDQKFEYSDALHTYFNISDIGNIQLQGLDNATFYEAFGNELIQQEKCTLHQGIENNRRYVNHHTETVINDPGFDRIIRAEKTGSKVTVVWNPGPATTLKISDMEPDGYRSFICAEPANAYEGIDMIELEPGKSFSLSAIISVV
jgi:glucose-6-phosphate 1-epimerase